MLSGLLREFLITESNIDKTKKGGFRPFLLKETMKDFYTYCIWDFNGTILDDVELGMNAVLSPIIVRVIDMRKKK